LIFLSLLIVAFVLEDFLQRYRGRRNVAEKDLDACLPTVSGGAIVLLPVQTCQHIRPHISLAQSRRVDTLGTRHPASVVLRGDFPVSVPQGLLDEWEQRSE
jgi:hypothetical protein